MSKAGERVFLSAEWRDLVMLNYEVDPALLKSYVPRGTELDAFQGKTFLSLVGFRFLRTRLFGILPLPFHTNFDEVNLRFYVRRRLRGENRRGVVFIREVVPKHAIALVARLAFGENYSAHRMRHTINTIETGKMVQYEWKLKGDWCAMDAQALGASVEPQEGSLDQFITEHYWGYAARRGGGSLEYHVSHVPWRVWPSRSAGFVGNADSLYGPDLAAILHRPPDSAFVADGSPVLVYTGTPIA
ncbi:MAG TPA: DUF2071 domain-containing protein [Candidatus Acidoferrales bacterium]|nr:DUF2071 domain-containing protein [Candidatus Acidoferrales bacterium]